MSEFAKIVKRWIKILCFKYVLRKMIRAMEADGWDQEDICSVLAHIAGEISVLTPSVKQRLGMSVPDEQLAQTETASRS
jgi:hypothetical protein